MYHSTYGVAAHYFLKDQLGHLEEDEVRKRFTDSDAEERDRIIAEHKRNVREMERQRDQLTNQQRDELAARLNARKLMREQLTRDKAVNDEMARIGLAQV